MRDITEVVKNDLIGYLQRTVEGLQNGEYEMTCAEVYDDYHHNQHRHIFHVETPNGSSELCFNWDRLTIREGECPISSPVVQEPLS